MDTSPQKPDDSSSSIFANSILRPSILSVRLPVSDAGIKLPEPEPSITSAKSLVEVPKFTPSQHTQSSTETSGGCEGFIFGKNMGSRVVNANQGASGSIWQSLASESQDNDQKESVGSVFTTLAKAVAKQSKEKEPNTELLEESAVALVNKRNAEQLSLTSENNGGQPHEILTGEENEHTVLELTCSAYVFNRESKQWKAIGQSYLHLNDPSEWDDNNSSRLIIRLQSTRRVVVNTRVWSEMPLAFVPESKAVRIGALALAEADGESGEVSKVGTVRTYMLRFGGLDTARELYDALISRRGSVELQEHEVDLGQKRVYPMQSNPVPVKVVVQYTPPHSQDASYALESDNDDPESDNESRQSETSTGKEADHNSTVSTSTNKTSAKNSSEVTAFRFHCERVILTSTSLPCDKKVEIVATSSDPPNSLIVNLVDFPMGGTSIIEVTSGNGELQVTTSVNERLAFCRNGEREFQLFYTAPQSSDVDDSSSDAEEGNRKVCQIVLTSEGDAAKLYRSVLMRVGRHFLTATGLLKECDQDTVETPSK
nr:RAN binding protein 3 [Hymenolepis microstoma]